MSAFIDAIADDFLGPLHLKPWWESLREYAYKASIAVIVLFSVFDKTKFHCLPIDSDSADFSEPQAALVDAMCGSMCIPWYISRGHLIALGMSVVTYLLSNYWIHQSGVKDKLTDLSTFGRSVLEMNMSAEEMQNAAVLPITCTCPEKRHRLRKNIQILLKYRCHASLSKFYTRRCFVVMIWTGICSGAAFWASIVEMIHTSTVPCQITDHLIKLSLGNTSNSFACLDKATIPTATLEMIFACTLLLQFCAMVVALWKQKTAIAHDVRESMRVTQRRTSAWSSNSSVSEEEANVSDARTFLIHMMGIDRRQAKKIRSFTKFVIFSDDFTRKLSEYSDEAITSGDVEYFRILKKRIPADDFWEEVRRTACVVLCEGDREAEMEQGKRMCDDPDDADYQVHIFLDKVFRFFFEDEENQFQATETNTVTSHTLENGMTGSYVEFDARQRSVAIRNQQTDESGNDTNRQEAESFGQTLMNGAKWHLLFCCPLTFEKPALLKDIQSDLLDDEGRSFLFYVLRRSSMDKLLSRFYIFDQLISVISNANKKLVHFDGKSMTPEDFFYQNYRRKFRGKLPDFRRCESCSESETNECEGNLENVFKEYHGNTDDNIVHTSLQLGGIKLTRMDGIAYEFAQKSIKNKHWEILVALINTYIVVYDQGKRPPDHDLMHNDIFRLKNCQHLEEICKEALKRPRCKTYFVPTAAEHILSLMDAKAKDEMKRHIVRSTLHDKTKARLQNIASQNYIHQCPTNGP